MATISIDIPDARVDEVKTALGNGVLLTNPQAKAAIITLIKDHVRNYYDRQAFNTSQTAIDTAVSQQIVAQQAAKTTADSIIIA